MGVCSESEKDIATKGNETEDHKHDEHDQESLNLLFPGLFAIRPVRPVSLVLSQVVCSCDVLPREV